MSQRSTSLDNALARFLMTVRESGDDSFSVTKFRKALIENRVIFVEREIGDALEIALKRGWVELISSMMNVAGEITTLLDPHNFSADYLKHSDADLTLFRVLAAPLKKSKRSTAKQVGIEVGFDIEGLRPGEIAYAPRGDGGAAFCMKHNSTKIKFIRLTGKNFLVFDLAWMLINTKQPVITRIQIAKIVGCRRAEKVLTAKYKSLLSKNFIELTGVGLDSFSNTGATRLPNLSAYRLRTAHPLKS